MITLDYFCAFASLVLQLKGRLEEVGVQPRCSIQTFQHTRRLAAIEATVSHKPSDDRAVLLLDESLIILLVGARSAVTSIFCARHQGTTTSFMNALSLSKSAPRMSQGKQVLCALHGPDNEPARARQQRHALGPTSGDIDHCQCLDKTSQPRSVPPWATMSTSQNPGGGSCQSLNVRNRDFTPHRRIKANPPPLTTSRSDFGLDQQAINRGCADGEHQRSTGLVELEPAMPLQRRQQRRKSSP